MEKIRVGIVNYLNTLPLIYGLEQSPVFSEIELVKDYPSRIATLLMRKEIDLGLIPVGVLPELGEYNIICDYGIACDGPVASVCLFSEVPVYEIDEVLLDYQSRTSLLLVQLLFRDYWKRKVTYVHTNTDFTTEIKGTKAGLIIGDRCLAYRSRKAYQYDLGEIWKQHTGLPFVFAVWAATRPLPESFISAFEAANANGIAAIDQLVKGIKDPVYDLHLYYKKNILYSLDIRAHRGMKRFLHDIDTLDK